MRGPDADPAHSDAPVDRFLALLIAGAVGVIGAARIASHASMWRDEAATALVIHRPFTGVIGVVLTDEPGMGPYFIALRIWSVVRDSDAWLRGFSVVGGACAAVALFHIVTRYFGRRAGLLSVVLLVANPVFLTYLTEARGYSWAMFLGVLSTSLLLRALESDDRRLMILYGVTTGVAVAVNSFVVLVVVAQLAGVVWAGCMTGRRRRLCALGVAVAVAMVVPFVPVFLAQGAANTSWIERVPLSGLVNALESVVGGRNWALLLFVGVVLLLARIGWRRPGPTAADGVAARVLVAIALLPAPMLVAISLVRPSFVDRYLTPILPFVTGAAAIGASYTVTKAGRITSLIAVGVAAALFATGTPFHETSFENLRAEAKFVKDNVQPSDVILFSPTWARYTLYRYWEPDRAMDIAVKEWPDTHLLPTEYSTDELRARLATHSRIWLVGYTDSTQVVSRWHPRPEPLQALLPELTQRPRLAFETFGADGLSATLLGPPP